VSPPGNAMLKLWSLLALVGLGALPAAAGDAPGGTAPSPRAAKRPLNRAFHGKILEMEKHRVRIFYDFEDPLQLKDFEDARPPRLLDAGQNRARIEGGHLILEGSTSIRHTMEGTGLLSARFTVRVEELRNVGAVFTEPILSDFYVVYNLFDYRFNRSGYMHIAACGLHEDEGAQDLSTGMVNFRDIFNRDIRRKVEAGHDLDVEVAKEEWKEFFRVNDVKGKGSSKGKTREMKSYQFGLFVHESKARFDDLTLTVELTDDYLELNNLDLVLAPAPLSGVPGVPPEVPRTLEAYLADPDSGERVVALLGRVDISREVRQQVAEFLGEGRDRTLLPFLMEKLRSTNATTRALALRAVTLIAGKTFGFDPEGGEAERARALREMEGALAPRRE